MFQQASDAIQYRLYLKKKKQAINELQIPKYLT